MKRSAREDKRTWMENKALAADKVAESGRNKELYGTMKTTAGGTEETTRRTNKEC